MKTPHFAVRSALDPGGHPVGFGDILSDLSLMDRDWDTLGDEDLLVRCLLHGGELNLSFDGLLPHSMTPEDMLKSLAAQMLVAHTKLKHAGVLESLQRTTQSQSLASVVRDVLDEAKADKAGGS